MWLLSLQVYWKKKEDEFSESLARLPSQAGSVGHGTRLSPRLQQPHGLATQAASPSHGGPLAAPCCAAGSLPVSAPPSLWLAAAR